MPFFSNIYSYISIQGYFHSILACAPYPIIYMIHGSVKVRDNWLRPPLGVNTQSGNWAFHPQWWP